MPDKNAYQTVLRSRVKAAIVQAEAADSYSHSGTKGSVRETLIRELFRPLLPADVGVGTGQIVSVNGQRSKQMDVVLYDKSLLPPVLHDYQIGVFPIESVLYTVEIKSTLTKNDLKQAHQAAKDLFGFTYQTADSLTNVKPAVSSIFALRSDLSNNGKKEAERYREIYTANAERPYLAAICVAGREYSMQVVDGKWSGAPDDEEFDGVLGFLGGVINSYKAISRSRGTPRLGYYIVPTFSKEWKMPI
jgi:hypothetical protein